MINALFILLSVTWIFEFVLFRNRQSDHTTDRISYSWVMLAIIIIIMTSLISYETSFLLFNNSVVAWLGLVLYGSGIFLRYWGIRSLGKQFTRHVHVQTNDVLVSHGPFNLLRHPLYTGLMLIVTGFSLTTLSLLGLMLVGLCFLPAILHRIRVEEAMLLESFGSEYKRWMKQRARLIPFIY